MSAYITPEYFSPSPNEIRVLSVSHPRVEQVPNTCVELTMYAYGASSQDGIWHLRPIAAVSIADQREQDGLRYVRGIFALGGDRGENSTVYEKSIYDGLVFEEKRLEFARWRAGLLVCRRLEKAVRDSGLQFVHALDV